MKKTKKKNVAKRRAKPVARAQAKKAKATVRAKPKRPAPKPARPVLRPRTGAEDAYEETRAYEARAAADPTLPGTRGTDEDAGDLEGLSRHELSDSESVEELVDEGQDFEAEEIEAVEESPDPDQAEVPAPRAPRRGPTPFKNRNRL